MAEDNNFIERIMELGIGISLAQQMPDMLSRCMPGRQPVQAAPPQWPTAGSYYSVVDDSQAGPFSEDDLMKMIRNGLMSKNTLVWKRGLAQWTPAANIPELNRLFLMSKV